MNTPIPGSNSILNKRIPTIIGLILLVVALVLGVFFISDGLGVFAPRATPETTPKKIKVTNVTDRSFTVSFMTDEATTGFVRYGTDQSNLDSQQTDDRNSLSSSVDEYALHHITVRSLQPNTVYFYILGTGAGARFDNQGEPFRIITARRGVPTANVRSVHGSVRSDSGAPAQGAVIYLSSEGVGEMSTVVPQSGAWSIPISQARTPDGSEYAKFEDETSIQLFVQGPSPQQTAQVTTTVAQAQPLPTLTYGQSGAVQQASQGRQADAASDKETSAQSTQSNGRTTSDDDSAEESATASSSVTSESSDTASPASGSARLPLDEYQEKTVFDLDVDSNEEDPPTLTTATPIIKGTIDSEVEVKITINSETAIEEILTTNPDGTFEIDTSKYEQILEPGEHTITLEFTNPQTGLEEVVTRTFFIEPQSTSTQLAQAPQEEEEEPFGTTSPFPLDQSSTQSAGITDVTATDSGTATDSAQATESGRTSMPSTASGIPVSGSVGTTLALIFGGLFFLISGTWSFWVSRNYAQENSRR
ncbi:MAG: fibronectin type III domain-containing protein [Patescibacteria group bacterium]